MSTVTMPMTRRPLSMRECAVSYAKRGYRVVPCAPGDVRPLARLVPHGRNDATSDDAIVFRWWTDTPNANIGISTTGLVVLIDDRIGRDLSSLAANHYPELCAAATSSAPQGATHYWFRDSALATKSTSRSLLRGISVVAIGGHVLAPPSCTDRGVYEWVIALPHTERLPDAPRVLISAVMSNSSRHT